ncbi:MAG: hypothetical protein LBJ13_01780 [Puniceicoccales bacterium]|jgi:hypothetical protein|nr:hypothetical protein [Puniceicoccales bacterium]
MKKLNLIKNLVVFSIFESFNMSFASPTLVERGFEAMSLLIGNVNQQSVSTFKTKIGEFIGGLQEKLNARKKKIKTKIGIAWLRELQEIAEKVLQYQQNPNQQLRNELEAIARTYGGEVRELIWSLPPPPPVVALPDSDAL